MSIHQCSRSMISLGDLFMSKISRIEYWKFFSMYPAPRFLSCLFSPGVVSGRVFLPTRQQTVRGSFP